MNIICVAGQLGRDAELRYLNNGDAVLGFSVADDQGRDKPTIWWNCSLFGKRAQSLAQYLTKGQKVTVSGTVTEREYTDKDGATKKAQDIRVSDVALQGQKQDAAPAPVREAGLPRPAPRNQAGPRPAPNFSDMDDDIPF
jgi:single-strand DNA-binding protein